MPQLPAVGGETERTWSHHVAWGSWLLGAALLAAVIAGALHFAEGRAFVRLAQQAAPWWLAGALALQIATYVAQGGIWRLVGRATGCTVTRTAALELSLAKLFADQTLPSAGLSSSIVIAKALERRHMPSAAVNASVLINVASYHLAYVIALVGALSILGWRGQGNAVVAATAVVFLLFSVGLGATILATAGRPIDRAVRRTTRLHILQTTLAFIAGADARLVRSPRILGSAISMQGAIVLLDAATMWALIRALGVTAPMPGVFASFMVASLFRTMGIVPGGLGIFEATSVLTLRMMGIDLVVALSATLLFRGLSFWLPMLPGYWCSRRALAPRPASEPSLKTAAFWSIAPDVLVAQLHSTIDGLSATEAAERLRTAGANVLRDQRDLSRRDVFVRQWRSPLLLLLVFAALASAVTGEWIDAGIVLTIVVATVAIGYSREYSAHAAAAALRTRVSLRATALRDGHATLVPPGISYQGTS